MGWLESCEKIQAEFKVKYPAAANAAEVINGQVKDFAKNLNLVRCLSSSDIKDDDWSAIQKVLKNSDLV